MVNKKIGFIGGGAMAEALIGGMLQSGLVEAKNVMVSDVSEQRLALLHDTYGVGTDQNNRRIAEHSDVLLLAVKPHIIPHIFTDIAGYIANNTLVVSIAAGVTIAFVESHLPHNPVIRVMPNTPAAVRAGMSAVALGSKANASQGDMVMAMFSAVGQSVILGEELLDAVTGLSGSGPGYGFVFIDALADAGVRVGLPRKTAIILAAQSLLGAAKMVLETGEHPAVLRDGVTSPGGTTIAGIHMLEQGGVRAAVSNAVYAACARSKEMGKAK